MDKIKTEQSDDALAVAPAFGCVEAVGSATSVQVAEASGGGGASARTALNKWANIFPAMGASAAVP